MFKYSFLFLILLSCSSLEKRADEHFDQGSFEEAIKLYEQALQKDPGDSDILAKLHNAQFKFIDSKLIAVRKLRVAKQSQAATDLLLTILNRQDEWAVFPKGAVAFSESEEVNYAYRYILLQVDVALKAEKPLFGSYTLKKYDRVLRTLSNDDLASLKTKVQALGLKQCTAMGVQAKPKLAFYAGLTTALCQFYGGSTKRLSAMAANQQLDLYARLNLNVKQSGTGENNVAQFTDLVNEQFRKSPWFDDAGKRTLAANASVAFDHSHQTEAVHRPFHYVVSIPYTDYENKSVAFQEPYTEYRQVCDAGAGPCRDVAETKYRTNYRTIKEPVTRYREEPRTYPLVVTRHHLALAYRSQIMDAAEGFAAADTSYAQDLEQADDEHHEHMQDIGLEPDPLKLTPWQDWLKEQYQRTASAYHAKLVGVWEQRYCQAAKQDGLASALDQYEKCLRSAADYPPEHINAFYQQTFGIDAKQVRELFQI